MAWKVGKDLKKVLLQKMKCCAILIGWEFLFWILQGLESFNQANTPSSACSHLTLRILSFSKLQRIACVAGVVWLPSFCDHDLELNSSIVRQKTVHSVILIRVSVFRCRSGRWMYESKYPGKSWLTFTYFCLTLSSLRRVFKS